MSATDPARLREGIARGQRMNRVTPQPPADTDALIEEARLHAALLRRQDPNQDTTDDPVADELDALADALAREREAREEAEGFAEDWGREARAMLKRAVRAEAQVEALANLLRLIGARHEGHLPWCPGCDIEACESLCADVREALASLPPQEQA